MAALGLVHVVGGDQHGEALAGEPVDLVPELAPGASGRHPAVGSSSSSSCGSCSVQPASASRCFQPPDSAPASWLAQSPSPSARQRRLAAAAGWQVRRCVR